MVPRGLESKWDGKREFKLGRTLSEAYASWSERMQNFDNATTFDELCDRYVLEHLSTTSYSNKEHGIVSVKRLKPVFGAMRFEDIEPSHAYRYFDLQRKEHSEHSAKADISHLKTILSCAVRWGLMNNNPLLGNVRIKLTKQKRKARYIHDWEVNEMLSLKSSSRGVKIIQPYIKLKLITGLRRIDILSLNLSDLTDAGIEVKISKTEKTSGVRMLFTWNDELRSVIDEILRIPPRRIGDAPLFVTREGKSYVNKNGQARPFNSIWQRFVAKVLDETNVAEKFMEKDFRAKVGSDHNTDEEAAHHLGHSSTTTTRKHYRLLPTIIDSEGSK